MNQRLMMMWLHGASRLRLVPLRHGAWPLAPPPATWVQLPNSGRQKWLALGIRVGDGGVKEGTQCSQLASVLTPQKEQCECWLYPILNVPCILSPLPTSSKSRGRIRIQLVAVHSLGFWAAWGPLWMETCCIDLLYLKTLSTPPHPNHDRPQADQNLRAH